VLDTENEDSQAALLKDGFTQLLHGPPSEQERLGKAEHHNTFLSQWAGTGLALRNKKY
jgi:hypothetical protein